MDNDMTGPSIFHVNFRAEVKCFLLIYVFVVVVYALAVVILWPYLCNLVGNC